jgi:hypothetical protein
MLASAFVGFWGCIDDSEFDSETHNAEKPIMGKLKISRKDITATSVVLESEVLKANGYPITERGFAWSTNPDSIQIPESQFQKINDEPALGVYIDTIKNLLPDVSYYFWSYARNEKDNQPGFSIGDTATTNNGKGEVETIVPKEKVRRTTANIYGVIKRYGEGDIKSWGVYYSESKDMANAVMKSDTITIEKDTFECRLINLHYETEYYVQAFVQTSFDVIFKDNVITKFKTTNGTPTVDSVQFYSIEDRSAIAQSIIIDSGDALVTERGFCYSSTISDPKLDSDGVDYVTAGTGGISGTLFTRKLENLLPRQLYYVRAYVKNNFGTAYGIVKSFQTISDVPTLEVLEPFVNDEEGTVKLGGTIINKGKNDIIEKGICYSDVYYAEGKDLYEKGERISITNNEFSETCSEFKGNVKYYICAYAKNSEGIGFSQIVTIDTPNPFYGVTVFGGGNLLKLSPTYFMLDDKAYLLGGDIGPGNTDKLWEYSSNRWNEMKQYPGTPSKWQSVVCDVSTAYIMGGFGKDKAHNEFYRYTTYNALNVWNKMADAPDSVYSSIGCKVGDALCYIGGKSGTNIDTVKNNVWSYDFSLNAWIKKPDFPVKQYGGIAHVINNVAYAGMGKNDSNICNKTIWTTTDVNTWTEETSNPDIVGGVLVSTVYKGNIYLVDESFQIHEYNPVTQKWMLRSVIKMINAGSNQDMHCMYVIDNMIYIGLINNILYRYNPLWDN